MQPIVQLQQLGKTCMLTMGDSFSDGHLKFVQTFTFLSNILFIINHSYLLNLYTIFHFCDYNV